MGWLTNKIGQWSLRQQKEELETYLSILKSMDGPEIGFVLAIATHMRHGLESAHVDLMDPMACAAHKPDIAIELSRLINKFQKQGAPHIASGLMVWAHTIRAAIQPELRGIARAMWGELQRGFPYVQTASLNERGESLNIEGAINFPAGFTPQPI